MRTVVVGAGFSGLAAALRLRLAGAEVTVLDALGRSGGKAALGWRDFSSGPTVVTMPAVLRGLHERAKLGTPRLAPASPTTAYRSPDGRTFAPGAYAVDGSFDPTLAQLSRQEARDYLRLANAAHMMYEDARDTFIFSPPPSHLQLARYGLTGGRRAFPGTRLADLVQSGPHLTPFWLRFATYLGADPYRAPAVLHNVSWVELGLGVWHLKGWEGEQEDVRGLGALAERMAARAADLGVIFEYETKVEQLIREQGRVVAAHTSRGVFAADAWVSAADGAFTRAWLNLPFLRRESGISGFALQLRLKESVPPSHHVLFPEDYEGEWRDIRAGKLPTDPTLYVHLDGDRGFFLVNAPPRPEAGADGTVEDKDGYAQFLLRKLRERLPLEIAEWLPLSPAEYARVGARGAIYGAAPHGLKGALRPGWTFPGLSNLAQVGGTVFPGGGVPLSLLSGWNGAGQLLGLPYDDLGGRA